MLLNKGVFYPFFVIFLIKIFVNEIIIKLFMMSSNWKFFSFNDDTDIVRDLLQQGVCAAASFSKAARASNWSIQAKAAPPTGRIKSARFERNEQPSIMLLSSAHVIISSELIPRSIFMPPKTRTDDSVTNDLPDPSSCHLCDNNQLKNDE